MWIMLWTSYQTGVGNIEPATGRLVLLAAFLWWTACLAGLFRKAKVPAALAFVPVVRLWFLARIGAGTGAGALLWFVPVLNIVWSFKFDRKLAARFGMSRLFGTCLFFLPVVFYPWLAFGRGPACRPVDMRSARTRDARGYDGGGFVEGLYESGDPAADRKKADMEELRRKYGERHKKRPS